MRTSALYCPVAALAIVLAALQIAGGPTPASSEPAKPAGGAVPAKLPQVDKAEHKGYTETIPGSEVKFDMVAVPGGVFLMGSPAGESGRGGDEGPQHPVKIRPFWMGKCEVTWDEFDVYRREKGADNADSNDDVLAKDADAITGPTPPYVDPLYGHARDGHPAICMSHHAAMEYCRWLSAKTGKTYRLPTEAEWEWAARAGTDTAYSFGDDPKDLGDYAWYAKNSAPTDGKKTERAGVAADGTTHKVGSKKPNPWGLHDMYGNVTEWCVDHYKKDLYAGFPADAVMESPVVLPTDRRFSHVVRGGSWADDPPALRSAARRGSDKTWIKHDPQRPQSIWWLTKMDVVGFRIVRAVDEQDNLKGLRSKITRESRN
jgi:formylglycine-generating enzyme required for sulfatase activity